MTELVLTLAKQVYKQWKAESVEGVSKWLFVGQLGASVELPRDGTVFVSVRDEDKSRVLPAILILSEIGFRVMATGGTQRFLAENGIEAIKINKVLEGRPHIEDAIRNRQVQLVINTTDGNKAISDSKSLRRAALMQKVP